MKPEEALDVLKRMRIALATAKVDGIRVFEPLSVAIQALEKQIPKKPNAYKDEYEHEFVPMCPTCEDWLASAREGYCSKCGQAIRWED